MYPLTPTSMCLPPNSVHYRRRHLAAEDPMALAMTTTFVCSEPEAGLASGSDHWSKSLCSLARFQATASYHEDSITILLWISWLNQPETTDYGCSCGYMFLTRKVCPLRGSLCGFNVISVQTFYNKGLCRQLQKKTDNIFYKKDICVSTSSIFLLLLFLPWAGQKYLQPC